MKVRFIQEVGTRAWLRQYWGDDCPNHWNSGKQCEHGYHNAQVHIGDSSKLEDWTFGGEPGDYPERQWAGMKCEWCGAPAPADAERQIHRKRLYNTPSGKPEPGDAYYAPWLHNEHYKAMCPWDNCNDPRGHLMVVLPDGHVWDTDARASNCTRKDDRTHRCWVKHGEPPDIHVGKNGDTCSAGAGSIISPREGHWHGFLQHGELVKC